MIRIEDTPKNPCNFIAVFEDSPIYKDHVQVSYDGQSYVLDTGACADDVITTCDHFLIPKPKLEPVVVYDMPKGGIFSAYFENSNRCITYFWCIGLLYEKNDSQVSPMANEVLVEQEAAFYIIGVK